MGQEGVHILMDFMDQIEDIIDMDIFLGIGDGGIHLIGVDIGIVHGTILLHT